MLTKRLKTKLFESVGIDQEKHSVKITHASFIKPSDLGKFNIPVTGTLMADLIFMRPDGDFKYILSVVDLFNRHMDAIPLKGRTAEDVIEGFEKVFKNKHFEDVEMLYTDPGSEFKNKIFKDYMNEKDVIVRYTLPNRKFQTGPIEIINHFITKTLYSKMTSTEIETNEPYSKWTQFLPNIVKELNKQENLKKQDLTVLFSEPRTTLKELNDRLPVGTVVFTRLQAPIDHLPHRNLDFHGSFRNGDIRFSLKPTEIDNVIISPNQPIRYLVKGVNNVSYMRKELLVADSEITKKYLKDNPIDVKKSIDIKNHVGIITRSVAKKLKNVV